MGFMRHFDHLTQLNSAGGVTLKRLEVVADFLDRSVLTVHAVSSPRQIQSQLFELYAQEGSRAQLAALSLRCLISHYIHQTCDRLGQQFGRNYQFEPSDLYRFVLDDMGHEPDSETNYQPLAIKILQSFDRRRGSLKGWTEQLVKQHPEVKAFLNERGLCLISDWALLNQATAAKIKRIYCDLIPRSSTEIQDLCEILAVYQQVYRTDLIQARQQGRTGLCPPPTEAQLQQMIDLLSDRVPTELLPQTLYQRLHELATHLREETVTRRRSVMPTRSLDDPALSPQVSLVADETQASPYRSWLRTYHTELSNCLTHAIQTVVGDRLHQYSAAKGEQFLKALHLFHCQAVSMTHIAEQLGFKAQFQVSRLLKLKELREDVRIRVLQCLLPRLRDSAYELASPTAIDQFDALLNLALTQQVDELLQQAQAETKTAKGQWQGTLFARMLCSALRDVNAMKQGSDWQGQHHGSR